MTELPVCSSESVNELFEALAAAQAELKSPAKNKSADIGGKFTYKYADLADVAAAIFATLPKHGLCLSQPTRLVGETMIIHTILGHKSGQWMSSEYPVCKIGDHRQMGGAMTYARRYAGSAIVGIAPDEDTDGAGAAQPVGVNGKADTGEVISKDQLKTLRAAIDETGADVAALCNWLKVDALPDVRAADYEKVMGMLNQKRVKRADKDAAAARKREEAPAA